MERQDLGTGFHPRGPVGSPSSAWVPQAWGSCVLKTGVVGWARWDSSPRASSPGTGTHLPCKQQGRQPSGRGGGGGGLTSASGRWMDWMVLRSCSKRAISSLCSAAVAVSSVTWTCSSAQRPGPKEDVAVRGT